MHDLVIIGGGPAALSAAVYAARAGLGVKVYEKAEFGGVLPIIAELENYPGFLGPGKELAAKMRTQAEQLGAELEYGECTSARKLPDGTFELVIDESPIHAKSVLVASGSEPKRLAFDLSIPVSYCALCDGAFTKGKNIVVVGGANSALQESLYLANLAASVVIVTHSQLKADQQLIARLTQYPNIKVVENVEPTRDLLEQFDYCFVYIGKKPSTSFLPDEVLAHDGFVNTDTASHLPHQTILAGLFAAGDVRSGSVKQIVTAAGDGAAAAIEVTEYLHSR